MSRIIRYEFMGNWLLFWILCVTIVGLPLAFLYLINGLIRIEESMKDPDRFAEEFREGKLASVAE